MKNIKVFVSYFVRLQKTELYIELFTIIGISFTFTFILDLKLRFVFLYVLAIMISLLFSLYTPSALFKKIEGENLLKSLKLLPTNNLIIFISIIFFIYLSQVVLIFIPLALWCYISKGVLLEICKKLNITIYEFIYIYYMSAFLLSMFISTMVVMMNTIKKGEIFLRSIPLLVILFFMLDKFKVVNLAGINDSDISQILSDTSTIKLIKYANLLLVLLIVFVFYLGYKIFKNCYSYEKL